MLENDTPVQRKRLGKIVSMAIPVAALLTGLLVINETNRYPRTDDAEVFANFIGIAPQVDGPHHRASRAGQRNSSSRADCCSRSIRALTNMRWRKHAPI